jgi:excisionase family DNA binding protein
MTYTVTPIQAAALIGVTPTTVRRWIASGELDARKVGPRKWLIAVESVESLRLGTPATPAPIAPVVNLAELAADLAIALGDLAIAAAAVREARAPRPPAPLTIRRAEEAIRHARLTLHAALDRLPPRSP